MSSVQIDREEVISRYQAIEDPHYRDRKEAHLERLRDEEAETGEVGSKYTNRVKSSKQRDEILKTLISAFLPDSRITNQTGWTFKSIHPLPEMDGESPEVVFGNPGTGGVIIGNILPERERPQTTIYRLEEAATLIEENRHTFSEEIGMDIDESDIRCALCVPEKSDRRAKEALEELQSEGLSIAVDIWRVDGPHSEKIDLYTSIDVQTDGGDVWDDVGDILRSGVEVAKDMHPLPDFFPDAHHQLVSEHTVGEMVQHRLRDDVAKTHFSETEFRAYIEETLSYSGQEEVAEDWSSSLLQRWEGMNLIEELSDNQTDLEGSGEFYRYNVDSRGAGNVMKEVKSMYKELAIDYQLEINAMRLVLEEFDEKQSSITEWGEEH